MLKQLTERNYFSAKAEHNGDVAKQSNQNKREWNSEGGGFEVG
jgi:hypothetical protein